MDFVKRYIYPSDYPNLILVNKEFYLIFKYSSPYVQLSNLLYKGGWFSTYTHDILHKMKFLDVMDCLIDSLENKDKKYYLNHSLNGITRGKIKKNKNLNYINLMGY
jgi:hypothetical protein